jgi:hypothetical protein
MMFPIVHSDLLHYSPHAPVFKHKIPMDGFNTRAERANTLVLERNKNERNSSHALAGGPIGFREM